LLASIIMVHLHSAPAAKFDPVEFWREQADVPLDVAVVETGETDGIPWRGIVYTSEICNGEPMRIFAWYARPAGEGKVPAVLSIHGGGGGADLPRAIAFAKAGYACLAYDWHTCNDPERPKWSAGDPIPSEKYTRYGNLRYTDWAGHFCKPGRANTRFAPTDENGGDWKHPVLYRAIQAGRRGLTWLGQQPGVDADSLVIEGHSWGSFLAQLLAGIDPRVKATVGSAAILGWRARYEQKIEGHVGSLTPDEFSEWEKRYDAALYAKKIKGPILIRCGASDFFGSIDTLPSYWDKIKAPKRLQLLPASNHTFGDVETRVQWFDHWLKGGPGFPEITATSVMGFTPGPQGSSMPCAVKVKGPAEITKVTVVWTTSPKQWNQRAWAQQLLEKTGRDRWTGTINCVDAGGDTRMFASALDANGRVVSSMPQMIPYDKMPRGKTPAVISEASVKVAKAPAAPGDTADDWKLAEKLGPLAPGPEVLHSQSAELQAMWAADALYLRLTVADATPWQPAAPGAMWFNGDSIQLRLRTDAKPDDPNVPAAEQRVLHLGWYPDGKGGMAVDAVRGRDFKGKIDDTSPVKCTATIDPNDAKPAPTYTLTVAIPWSFIDPEFKPVAGRAFKFALQVNYADLLTNERAGMIDFNHAGEFSKPEAWGTATLAE